VSHKKQPACGQQLRHRWRCVLNATVLTVLLLLWSSFLFSFSDRPTDLDEPNKPMTYFFLISQHRKSYKPSNMELFEYLGIGLSSVCTKVLSFTGLRYNLCADVNCSLHCRLLRHKSPRCANLIENPIYSVHKSSISHWSRSKGYISKYGAYTAQCSTFTEVLSTHFCQNCHSFFKLATWKIHSWKELSKTILMV